MKISRFGAAAVCAAAALTLSLSSPAAYADKWVGTDGGYVYKYDDGTTAESGWLKLDGKTYYIRKDSTRQTGWLTASSGKKYYFGKDGVMYKNRWASFSNGDKYYFGSSGAAAAGFVTVGDNMYYFDSSGKMKTGWLILKSGSGYYFNKDGSMARSCSLKFGDTVCTFDASGRTDVIPEQAAAKDKDTQDKTPAEDKAPADEKISAVPSDNEERPALKEFKEPSFGASKTKVLKECGISDQKKISDQRYIGMVIWKDRAAMLTLEFNSDGKLCTYVLGFKCSSSDFQDYLKAFKKELGKTDYTDKIDGDLLYGWKSGTETTLLTYSKDNEYMGYIRGNSRYEDPKKKTDSLKK